MSIRVPEVPTLTRRSLFKVGAVAISGFDLLPMLRPLNATVKEKVRPRGTAEYCLFVFLQGGCSHVDSFDLKEGKWTPPDFEIKQVAPGIKMPVSLFPKLSRDLNKFAILRSLETWETEHERAIYYMHAAHGFSPARAKEIPSVGAIVAYESRDKRKDTDFLPPFMSMNYGRNQVKQGCLEARYGPLNIDTRGGDLSFVVPQEEKSRFDRRIAYLNELSKLSPGAIVSGTAPVLQANAFRADALGMKESPEIPKILKLDEEEKKRYGNSGFGDACLLARNILAAERGTRFVAVKRGSRPAVIFFCDASEPPSSMIPSTPEVIPMAAPAPAKERLKERLSLEERIQRRAYELYVQRGNESGSELDDWLQAEEEIRRAKEQPTNES